MTSYRNDQLADVVRSVIARYAVKVPPSVATLVTVTDVRLTADLGYADVYLSAIKGADAAISFLKKERMREIKKQLSIEFRAHHIPMLRFHTDDRGEKAHHLETLIDSL